MKKKSCIYRAHRDCNGESLECTCCTYRRI